MTIVKASAIINIKTIEGSAYMNKKEEYQEKLEFLCLKQVWKQKLEELLSIYFSDVKESD